MSKAQMVPAKREELMNLIDVLGLNRIQFAQLCEASPNTVGWWLKEEMVPKFRFHVVGKRLYEKLPIKDLSVEQAKAKHLVETVIGFPLEILLISGSAISGVPHLNLSGVLFHDSIQPFNNENKILKENKLDQPLEDVNPLKKLSLEELLREIGRRGFKVQIEPRE